MSICVHFLNPHAHMLTCYCIAARLAKWKGQSSAARDKVKGKGKEESTLARLARFQGKLDSSAAGTAVRAHKLAFGDK